MRGRLVHPSADIEAAVGLLSQRLDLPITASDVLAYIAAVTAHSGYTARFAEDLRTPGVRIPLTADPELWAQAVQLGRRVIWLHTYGERFDDPAEGRPSGPPKPGLEHRAKVQVAIPGTAEEMPDDLSYDAETATLHVGGGRISPVRPEVWAYEVSGMKVVNKWFGYDFMRRVLATDHGGELYRKRQPMIEPVLAQTKFNQPVQNSTATRQQPPDPARRRRPPPKRLEPNRMAKPPFADANDIHDSQA